MSEGITQYFCIRCQKYFKDTKLSYLCPDCAKAIHLKRDLNCDWCNGTGITSDKIHRCIKCSMRRDEP